METLLKEVYIEYNKFYEYKRNRPLNWNQKLEIKKEETVTRPKAFPEEET